LNYTELWFERQLFLVKGAYLKYSSDEEFLNKVIRPICGWNLTIADIEANS
jgi:hypothetical protein